MKVWVLNYKDDWKEYLSKYGWHFSQKLCEYACRDLIKYNKDFKPYTKEEVDKIISSANVSIEKNEGWDYVYIANMCKADFLGNSVPDENHLAKYVKDYIDDYDGYEGIAFVRYLADLEHECIELDWCKMI